jgi:hypothetical protein
LELFFNTSDLLSGSVSLLRIQLTGSCSGQPPVRPVYDRRRHLQIPQYLGGCAGGGFRLLPLGFEE